MEKIYNANGCGIFITPTFIYEISIYQFDKKSYILIGTKIISSKKPLKYKEVEYQKYDPENPNKVRYVKYIEWVGAPESYIKENNLKLIENGNVRRRNREQNGSNRKVKGPKKGNRSKERNNL